MRIILLATLLLRALPAADAYIEQNGIVVAEMESGQRIPIGADSWSLQTANAGYTGVGYLEWMAGSSGTAIAGKNTDVVSFDVTITTTGTYRFVWRSSRPPESEDQHNDAFLRCVQRPLLVGNPPVTTIPANTFNKCYHSTANGAWAWGGTLDTDAGKKPPYIVFDQPGTYTIQIGGRSNLFRIDRWALYHIDIASHAAATDITRAESTTGAGGGAVDPGDDDGGGTPPPTSANGEIRWTTSYVQVGEETPSIVLRARRYYGFTGAISATWTATAGTASDGSDFTAGTGTVAWGIGDSADRIVSIPIHDDAIAEPTEIFTVVLSEPTGGAELGPVATTTVGIIDDDGPPVVQFTSDGFVAYESAGYALLSLQRTGSKAAACSVDLSTIAGTAQAGTHFQDTTGTVTWPAGDRSIVTFAVPLVADEKEEPSTEFTVTLSSPSGADLGSRDSAEVMVVDWAPKSDGDAPCGTGTGLGLLMALGAFALMPLRRRR